MTDESNWASQRRRISAAFRTTSLLLERSSFLAMSEISISLVSEKKDPSERFFNRCIVNGEQLRGGIKNRSYIIKKNEGRVANVWRDFCFLVKMLTALEILVSFSLSFMGLQIRPWFGPYSILIPVNMQLNKHKRKDTGAKSVLDILMLSNTF